MKCQKQKGYQTKLHHFLYQEGNTKNFEKTCIPCRLYHLVNITGKNLTTVSFPKVFTEVRSDGKLFFTTSFLRLKPLWRRLGTTKEYRNSHGKCQKAPKRCFKKIGILKFAIRIFEKTYDEVYF